MLTILLQWIDEVRTICGPVIPVILVGCKSDLRPPPQPQRHSNIPPQFQSQYEQQQLDSGYDETRFVSPARAQRVAAEIGARAYKECSALKIEVRVCAVHAWTPC